MEVNVSSLVEFDKYYISQEVIFYFVLWFAVVATDCLTAFSIVSNIINVTVFVKLGLKERVNFTLFWLSFSDLLGAVFVALMSRGYIGDVQVSSSRMDSSSYVWCLVGFRTMFVDLSSALTVFITIERCSCVVRPLHFNTSFVARHGRAIVVVIILFVVANYVPLVSTFGYEKRFDEETNSSILYVTFSEINLAVQQYNDYVFGFSLAVFCQFTIFLCAILMYRGLKNSSKIRTVASSFAKTGELKSNGLSYKERRVVKMILILANLYMVTACPQIAFSWTRILITDFRDNKIGNLAFILEPIVFYTSATYGAFSIFIYYYFSSNYRVVFKTLN